MQTELRDIWTWDDARRRALAALDNLTPEGALTIVRLALSCERDDLLASTLAGLIIGSAQATQDQRQRGNP